MRFSASLMGLICSTSLLLSACQHSPESSQTATGSELFSRQTSETLAPDCQGQSCPLMNIDTLFYPQQPHLNQEIERRLLRLADPTQQWPRFASLKAFQSHYLANAQPGWADYVQAKQRAAYDDIIVLELSSYLERGAEQGIPGRGFINYRPSTGQVISLEHMIIPGQEQAFWQVAAHAHRLWLLRSQLDLSPEHVSTWSFKPTEHIALLPEQLVLKYDVNTIAPYSSGHPELLIDYAALRGILKPEFLPMRDR